MTNNNTDSSVASPLSSPLHHRPRKCDVREGRGMGEEFAEGREEERGEKSNE